jgi:hypothetical protein
MPSLLSAIAKSAGGPGRAMEVLDALRALRQSEDTADGFRMVMTGSIGLHHVIEVLRDGGYSNPALNDLEPIDVPPLDPAEAQNLAKLLIEGEKLKTADVTESACVIAEETGGFPFYLQSVYTKEEKVALAILDVVALADEPLSVPDVVRQVKQRGEADDEQVRKLLKLLAQDHYVTCDDDGRYSFRFPLLCRWWKLDRGL